MSGTYNDITIGEVLSRDLRRYSYTIDQEIRQAMRDIQKEMVTDITAITPIRHYPWNNGIKRRIITRYETETGQKRTVRENAPENDQPGSMRKGWIKATLDDTTEKLVIGVRNKTRAPAIHLVNFGHDMYTHNHRIVGYVQGNGFVDRVENDARQKLDAEINQILGG